MVLAKSGARRSVRLSNAHRREGGQTLIAERESCRSLVQDNTQQGAVDLKPAVVLNETQFLNWVLREACARRESLGPEQP